MMTRKGPILVTGATGAQGGAVVDALLQDGVTVRALVRNPEAYAARDLAERGVELAKGDFDDPVSLASATKDAVGVFSVQTPPMPNDLRREIRAGENLISAARDAGVKIFVHTSVARAGDHEKFIGWNEGRWWPDYWTSKAAVNEAVKAASFAHWVILKPAVMMENLIPPKADRMHPSLVKKGVVETALLPDARLDMIAAADIGYFAAAAFADPERFAGKEIDLAAEALTMDETAHVLSNVTGKNIFARSLSPKDARAAGIGAGIVQNHQWVNVEGYKVDINRAKAFGVPLTPFAEWATQHASDFVVGAT